MWPRIWWRDSWQDYEREGKVPGILGRLLCRLNQHIIVTEMEQWTRPDAGVVADFFGPGMPASDNDGIIQTRCARMCGLIFAWSFIRRHGEARQERADYLAAIRAGARAMFPAERYPGERWS